MTQWLKTTVLEESPYDVIFFGLNPYFKKSNEVGTSQTTNMLRKKFQV